MIWGPIIAWYLFLAGASAGAFVTSAYLQVKYPAAVKVRVAARVLALVLMIVGLVMLMVDAEAGLHNPLRFFYLVANPASVMTIGVYVICAYLVVALVAAALDLMKRDVPKALSYVGCALALAVAAYTGFLLGAATPFPLWSNAALPVLFVVSGASAGLAATALVGNIVDASAMTGMRSLAKLGAVAPVVEAFVLFCMLAIVAMGTPEGAASVAAMVSGEYAVAFWLGLVVVGLVMPFAVEVYNLRGGKHIAAVDCIAHAGVLVGGFMLRYLVIAAAVAVLCI